MTGTSRKPCSVSSAFSEAIMFDNFNWQKLIFDILKVILGALIGGGTVAFCS